MLESFNFVTNNRVISDMNSVANLYLKTLAHQRCRTQQFCLLTHTNSDTEMHVSFETIK